MAHVQTDAQRATQAAIDEAARTVTEASRRTSEQAQQATRTLLDQSMELNRTLVSNWAASGEACWRAAFEVQNAQLQATLAWWQSIAEGSRASLQMLQQLDTVTRQAQQTWLDSLQASARTLASMAEEAAIGVAERGAGGSR
jgi:hypothetical protein